MNQRYLASNTVRLGRAPIRPMILYSNQLSTVNDIKHIRPPKPFLALILPLSSLPSYALHGDLPSHPSLRTSCGVELTKEGSEEVDTGA